MSGGLRSRAHGAGASARAWSARVLALAAACALSACIIGGQTGQSADSEGQCNSGRVPIARDQHSELGFSPEQGAARFAPRRELALIWSRNAGSVPAQLSLQFDALDAILVRERCATSLELVVLLSFRSDDGQLDEQVPATLTISADDRAQLTARVALDALRGSYDAQADGAGDLRAPVLVFDGSFEGTDSTGSLTLVETVENGGEPRSIVVGSWSLAR